LTPRSSSRHDELPVDDFHPLVREWFLRRFGAPTPVQRRAWPCIRAGGDVLVAAPTGSGKTLAAFLGCLDELLRRAWAGELADRTEIVYVSPLRALSHDIETNLHAPLAELASLATARGLPRRSIRVAVRTGDTPPWERQRMRRTAPHILVTTPESLFILLTAEQSRQLLRAVRLVIVDEIHAVVSDKRGAHLALSLARLDHLVRTAGGERPQRVGLSATVNPLEEVAAFLAGSDPDRASEGRPPVAIVDEGHRRPLDLAVEVPLSELGAVATNEMWAEVYDRLAELVRAHRTTLVFVNTRRLAERVAHHLGERLGPGSVLAHHGSLSRKVRRVAETRLKAGELKAIVATSSLELGIDVGTIDLVCQIGSPRTITAALQRVGRSGHRVDRPGEPVVPKGRLFATTRDELVELAALVRAIREGRLERLSLPRWPRDVLAQQIVAAAACESWSEEVLFDLVRRAYPYRDLPRAEFDAIIEMLSQGIAARYGRRGAYLHRDAVHRRVRARRGARLAAITSGGAIPDTAAYQVVAEPDGTVVGTVDEDFAVESLAGDVFLLGSTSWRIRRVEAGRVRVEDAQGAPPSIPFWRGEAPGRSAELSQAVSRLRADVAARLEPAAVAVPARRAPSVGLALEPAAGPPEGRDAAIEFLMRDCGLDRAGATQAVAYLAAGQAALGAMPTDRLVVAERFFDEAGGMQLVVHAPFGARLTRAWGLALRKRFCRTFNVELQAAATDNGLVLSLSEQHSFPLDVVFAFLRSDSVEEVLVEALVASPMFTARWRWNAARALAVLRFAGGRKVPPPLQRIRAEELLAAVFPDQVACAENLTGPPRIPDHPLVNETIRDCLHEAMDLDGLRRLLRAIETGAVRTVAIDTPTPSVLSHEILNANPYAFLDDAPLEERRARAVSIRRTLGGDLESIGGLDAAAIEAVARDAWPVVRDAEELHEALLTLVVLPPVREWTEWFDELQRAGRAATLVAAPQRFWVPAEAVELARRLYPGAVLVPEIGGACARPCASREEAAVEVVRGWLASTGPQMASRLAGRLGLPRELVDIALARLEGEGTVLRGRFTPAGRVPRGGPGFGSNEAGGPDEVEWCDRHLLARIHRLTLGRLRREIEPVTSAEFVRFLCRWQHVAPGSQWHGIEGTRQVVRQLQGYELPAHAWEAAVLRRRVARYDPGYLDALCLSGEVMWARLSSPLKPPDLAAGADAAGRGARRVRPTRIAPVTLLLRDDAAWLVELAGETTVASMSRALSHAAAEVAAALERHGALFFSDLVRLTGRLASEVEEALWELVAVGLATADGFDNLRALVDPKRRRGEGQGRSHRPRHAPGRWALVRPALLGRTAAPAAEAPTRSVLERLADQLLLRWGVVFRELLAREALAPPWRELVQVLRRMEARGEVRGGRFVAGFVGEQFARPEAVELLRTVRRAPPEPDRLAVAAADPLNLVGILLPGARVSPMASETVELFTGAPALTAVSS
jgi:ATP-dependent Lhr-like helicase